MGFNSGFKGLRRTASVEYLISGYRARCRMIFPLPWDIRQRTLAIRYRPSRVKKFKTIDDGTDRLARNFGTELPLYAA